MPLSWAFSLVLLSPACIRQGFGPWSFSSVSITGLPSGVFSSDSMWMLPDRVDGLRWALALDAEGWLSSTSSLSSGSSFSSEGTAVGWYGAMAERMQLNHCCLWKTSLACSVWDWPGGPRWVFVWPPAKKEVERNRDPRWESKVA